MKSQNAKFLFYASLVILVYFVLLFLNAYVIKSSFVFIGVIQELVTIPAMIIQIILLFFAIKSWKLDQYATNKYSFWAFCILIILNLVTTIPFLYRFF